MVDQLSEVEKEMKWHTQIVQFAKPKVIKKGKGKYTIVAAVPNLVSVNSAGQTMKTTGEFFNHLGTNYIKNTARISINHLGYGDPIANFGSVTSVSFDGQNLEAELRIKEKWLNNIIENDLYSGFSPEFTNIVLNEDGVSAKSGDLIGITVALPPATPICPKGSCDVISSFCNHVTEFTESDEKEECNDGCTDPTNPCDPCKEKAKLSESSERNNDNRSKQEFVENKEEKKSEDKKIMVEKELEQKKEERATTQVVAVEELEAKFKKELQEKEAEFIGKLNEVKQQFEQSNSVKTELETRLAGYVSKEKQEIISKLPKLTPEQFTEIGAATPEKGWENFELSELKKISILLPLTSSETTESSGVLANKGVKVEAQKTKRELEIEEAKNAWRKTPLMKGYNTK